MVWKFRGLVIDFGQYFRIILLILSGPVDLFSRRLLRTAEMARHYFLVLYLVYCWKDWFYTFDVRCEYAPKKQLNRFAFYLSFSAFEELSFNFAGILGILFYRFFVWSIFERYPIFWLWKYLPQIQIHQEQLNLCLGGKREREREREFRILFRSAGISTRHWIVEWIRTLLQQAQLQNKVKEQELTLNSKLAGANIEVESFWINASKTFVKSCYQCPLVQSLSISWCYLVVAGYHPKNLSGFLWLL